LQATVLYDFSSNKNNVQPRQKLAISGNRQGLAALNLRARKSLPVQVKCPFWMGYTQ